MRIILPLTVSVLAASTIAQTTVYDNTAPRAAATVIAGSDAGAPSLRMWGGSATDGTRMFNFGGRTVSSAGNAGSVYYNGLDAYDPGTNTWTNLSPDGAAGAPSNRFRMAFGYDPVGNRLVSYGGLTAAGGTILSDCWVFDLGTNTWSQIPNPTPGTTGPVATMDAKICYDAASGLMVLFGGSTTNSNATAISDTWLLAGTTWVPIAVTPGVTAPLPRRMHGMCERTGTHGDILVTGGFGAIRYNDTWRWDGVNTQWIEVTPINNTVPVTFCGGNEMVYDSVRDVCVIIGGPGTNVAPSNLTGAGGWSSEYDCANNEWRAFGANTTSQAADDPIWGNLQRFVCEFINGKTYFWAGQNPATLGDSNLAFVKEYQADPVASAVSYGAGCNGQSGAGLNLVSNNTPWTGRTWSGTCTTMGPASFALSVYGFATASLPLDAILPGFGQPGCVLLNTADAIVGPDLPGAGSVTISLPFAYDPTLAGAQLHVQVAELDFTFTSLWTSNGITLTVGAL